MNKEKLRQYLEVFCSGSEHSKKAKDIGRAVCISEKELRKLVNRLRQEGVPIGSSRKGYFYAVTAGEVYATIRFLEAIKRALEAAIAGLVRSLDSFDIGRREQ